MPSLLSISSTLLAALILSGCGSVIKVQHNPFEREAAAIRSYQQKLKNHPHKSTVARQQEKPDAEPAPSRQQYFGRGESRQPTTGRLRKNKAVLIADSEAPASSPGQPPAGSPPPLSPAAALPQHKPVTSGPICYTCNGKGYVFSPQDEKGTLCGQCGGKGQR